MENKIKNIPILKKGNNSTLVLTVYLLAIYYVFRLFINWRIKNLYNRDNLTKML